MEAGWDQYTCGFWGCREALMLIEAHSPKRDRRGQTGSSLDPVTGREPCQYILSPSEAQASLFGYPA